MARVHYIVIQGLMVFLLFITSPVYAHKVKLFVSAEGLTLHGYAYFSGGNSVQNIPVLIQDMAGNSIGTVQTDAQGKFTYVLSQAQAVQLSINTGDGHQASYQLQFSTQPSATVVKTAPLAEKMPADTAVLSTLIEQAVYQQVQPLREQLEHYEEKVRLHDILGGLGYIVGILGFWFFVQGRRLARKE
ncbi:hypothetical protein BegalDRAFT_1095 [Beggiatoa alba B18LD]|uniref:Nickel transport protein n=1 Tax=Beggiatoa alba B18LD TaxID=395493 RepID=I3CEF5_9GAMM|nr:hypothetical protein BegalDRAFT_1095 [Beggiatoa alba B18LD]